MKIEESKNVNRKFTYSGDWLFTLGRIVMEFKKSFIKLKLQSYKENMILEYHTCRTTWALA